VKPLDLDDEVPGPKPVVMSEYGGDVACIMRVAIVDPSLTPLLFIRSDADGQIFVAIESIPTRAINTEP
jgi:hypothetical protein